MTTDLLPDNRSEDRQLPRRGALAVLATAQLVLALDYSIVNIALPSIGGSLGFSRDAVEWVVSAYALLFGGFLLFGGRSSDLLGRRRIFIASGVLFGVASMVGGLSTTPAILLAGRAVQGLAAGFLFPATLSLVTTTFPEGPSRNRAISVWGAAGAGGLAFGAFLGGIIISALGWRWVFFVNVPVLAILVFAAPLVLPGHRPPRPRVRDFDVPGATTVTAGALLVVLALIQAPVAGWTSPGTVIPAAVGLVLLAAFLWIEDHSKNPLMPLELLRRPTLWGGMLVTAAFMASFGLQFFFLTMYLQSSLHESPLIAGLSFLPLALLVVVGNNVGGRLATRYGAGRVLPWGMVIGAVGLLAYEFLGPRLSLPTLLAGEAIAGFGQGMAFTTAYLVAGSGIDADRQGVASSMASTAQQLGGSIGLAVLVDLLSARLGASGGHGLVLDGASVPGLIPALHWVYAAQASLALIGAAAAALVIGRRLPRRRVAEPAVERPVAAAG
jgi:EmrB/QacA subfamily drug resistance transporter